MWTKAKQLGVKSYLYLYIPSRISSVYKSRVYGMTYYGLFIVHLALNVLFSHFT